METTASSHDWVTGADLSYHLQQENYMKLNSSNVGQDQYGTLI